MARKHALIYVRKDGTKVPVWSSPVGGQLRFTRLKNQITDIRFDIKATRDSVRFWKSELKKAKD